MSHHNYYDPEQDSTPLQRGEFNPPGYARRAFWRGVVIGGLIVGGTFIASAAWGETISIGGIYINGAAQFGTTVSIEPSGNPGELAVVTLVNEHVNQGRDTGQYFVGMDGLVVEVQFTWDENPLTGADRITVIPPEGITCLPADCSATVLEGMAGTVVLLDWVGS